MIAPHSADLPASKKDLLLAHDLGTSSNKACLFNKSGEMLDHTSAKYPTYYPHEDWAEQDPEDWWAAVQDSTRILLEKTRIDPRRIAAISFSAQTYGCLPIDERGAPLMPRAMIWMDARSRKQSDFIEREFGKQRHYARTGNSLEIARFPCSKIMWMRENRPREYARAHKFIGVKEYIIRRLTGEHGLTDFSEAQMSGLFNIWKRCYDAELMDLCGIRRELLCDPRDSTCAAGRLTDASAKRLGLFPDTPVILGMADNPSAALAAGGLRTDVLTAAFGTAAWIGVIAESPLMLEGYRANAAYMGMGYYRSSIHTHAGSAALNWAMENLLRLPPGQEGYDEMERLADKAPSGAGKLFFMPSFLGGNSLFSDPDLCGGLLGLRLHHTPSHIARAAYQGVCFDLMMGAQFFARQGHEFREIRAIGGGAKSRLLCRILADMLRLSVKVPRNLQHMGAIGAALNAGIGCGMWKDFSQADLLFRTEDVIEPDASQAEIYRSLVEVYRELYRQLIPCYEKLAAIRLEK